MTAEIAVTVAEIVGAEIAVAVVVVIAAAMAAVIVVPRIATDILTLINFTNNFSRRTELCL